MFPNSESIVLGGLHLTTFELWCWRRLLSPLDCKEIKPINPKGNQCWIFIRRTDAETEALILWGPDMKNWLIGKDPDAGKDWRREKGMTEDEMVGWHYRLDGQEFEQALRVGDGQGSLARSSPWSCKESDMTEWWNLTPHGMWGLSSPTRDGTHVPCSGSLESNHWTTRKVPLKAFILWPPLF